MQRTVLRVVVRSMRKHAEENGWRWNEPVEVVTDDGTEVSYCWFGNGPQGSEPARLMLCMDEGNIPVSSVISIRSHFTFDYNVFRAYHQYLQVNQWEHLSFTLWFEVTWNRVRRRFKGVMRQFNSRMTTLFSGTRGSRGRIT